MKLNNLTILTISISIYQFASGLIGPFYVLYIQKIGGTIENLGIAFGILAFFSAVTTYLAGRYSDKIGRKPPLIFAGYLIAILFLLYLLVKNVFQLYILQAIFGIVNSVFAVMERILVADITKSETRGMQIGRYDAVVGIFASLALISGGFLIGKFGFEIVFFLFSGLGIISTTILFLIKEKARK